MVFRGKNRVDIEFHNNFFDCPYGDKNNPACTAYTGDFVIDQLGIPRDYVTTGCLALTGFILFYIFTSWLFLQFLSVKITFSKQVQSGRRENGTAEAIAHAKSMEQRRAEITIRIQDLSLWINKRTMAMKRLRVDILQGITVDFVPGKLNVIMGPSGRSIAFYAYYRIWKKQSFEYSVSTITWIIDSTIPLLGRATF